ncbi:MAG: PQQ-dependent sugar dehydrogenase [Bacteroidota bacterium]|nr:PQQ-dependent sugar dehydrogenase [Bacteroidota bacterium]
MKSVLLLLSILLPSISFSQGLAGKKSGTSKNGLTPVIQVKLIPTELKVPSKFKSFLPGSYSVNIPEGYEAQIFCAGGFSKPRFMDWSPDSVLHVICMNSGDVIAMPDKNHDHIADTSIVVAKNAYGHDLEFYKNDLYVAEEMKVEKLSDLDKDGFYETRVVFIDSILPGKQRPPGGHTSRTIVFDDKNQKVYLSVGSLCNVCRETHRAVIYEYDINGKNKKIFASGTRNCVGMTLNPSTNKLWATNNGSDHQGNEIPPEWVDVIEKDGFYGYPFAYGYRHFFDFNLGEDYKLLLPITSTDSALVNKMKAPEALLQSHSAPMAIDFSNSSFKKNYRSGAFIAYRGSWDREPATGYKAVFLHFDKDQQVTGVSDFLTGFLHEGGTPWARPVGIETDLRGNLFLGSDNINEFILIVSPKP